MKKKVIYVAPHLSTGGLPQYLCKKIELIREDYDIYLIEYENVTGGVLVVQRNKIAQLVDPSKFYTLGQDKSSIVEIINSIDPDIIHMEEMPEYFMDDEIANKIYTENRRYKIFETSHDSSFDHNNKRFFPDKMLLVSNYQVDLLKPIGVPCEVVEYPIEYKDRPERSKALAELGLDPDYKHVINVGLFTPRKNQAEVFEYAKKMTDYKIKFHFIGNHADNFKYYWEPLLKNVPPNCVIWGERSDTHKFYEAADLFLFTSRGFASDKETSPLVIKEAIGYRIPSLIYNLDVYQNMYNKYDNIQYLSESGNNIDIILKALGIENKNYLDYEPIVAQNLEKINLDNQVLPVRLDFNDDDNKISFIYEGRVDEDFDVSIKDIDSKACIYSALLPASDSGFIWWCIPLPKHVIDFKNNPNFGGFIIEFRNKSGNLLISKEIRIKNIPINKPVMDITNSEPIFMNYEEFFTDRVYDILEIKNPKTVLDIGASLGLWTKYILHNGAEKVYCFEPNKRAISHLRKTLENDKNITIIEKAVYKERGELQFYIDDSNSITSSLYSIDGHHPSYNVTAITLEDAINLTGEQKIDLIKIDIEGAEFDIIKNTPNEVFNRVNSFIIEYHDFLFMEGDAKVFGLERRLKDLGYNVIKPNIPNTRYIFATKNSLKNLESLSISNPVKIPVKVDYDSQENKITFSYIGRVNEEILVSIKDIDSKACIYSLPLFPSDPGVSVWCIPLPKNVIDFKNHPLFGGFLIQFRNSSKEIIESIKIRIKEIPIEKPVMDISDSEPIFNNYEEFFVKKIYDDFNISDKKIVLDIGANVGLWSKYIIYKGSSKVYCFEPNRKALEHLNKTFKAENNVTIFNLGIYKEKSKIPFYIDESNSLVSSVLSDSNNQPSYEIECITLKDALEMTGETKIDLVKMDIEGAEFEVIDNLDSYISSKIDSFLIEYHDFYFADGDFKISSMEKKLVDLGYQIQRSKNPDSRFIFASR